MMDTTSREEFYAIVNELDRASAQMALLVLQFRRIGRERWPDQPEPASTDEPQITPPWTTK